jgi:WD40 repeat protein
MGRGCGTCDHHTAPCPSRGSTEDGGLEYRRSLPSIDRRVLSVAWAPHDESLFVGGMSGTIHHFNPTNGQSNFRMTLESRGSLKPAFVWCLKVGEHASSPGAASCPDRPIAS